MHHSKGDGKGNFFTCDNCGKWYQDDGGPSYWDGFCSPSCYEEVSSKKEQKFESEQRKKRRENLDRLKRGGKKFYPDD